MCYMHIIYTSYIILYINILYIIHMYLKITINYKLIHDHVFSARAFELEVSVNAYQSNMVYKKRQ